MTVFEPVSKYADAGIQLPVRTTQFAAGYDMFAAQDIVIAPFYEQLQDLNYYYYKSYKTDTTPFTLDELAEVTKLAKARPTLVSTGVKVQLDSDRYLQLVSRSSVPYKNWLIIANGVGK